MKKGFTLIELIVSVTIISILIASGLSAYSKAQQRQLTLAATDSLISNLENIRKNALIGNRPGCTGVFQGYLVTTTNNTGKLTSTAVCTTSSSSITITIPNLTFVSTQSFTFKPLTGGSSLAVNLDYLDPGDVCHRLAVSSAGKIENLGNCP